MKVANSSDTQTRRSYAQYGFVRAGRAHLALVTYLILLPLSSFSGPAFGAQVAAPPQVTSAAPPDGESLDLATKLENQGKEALNRGDLAKAEEYHQRALTTREKLSPGSLEVASSLNNLGLVAYSRGDCSNGP